MYYDTVASIFRYRLFDVHFSKLIHLFYKQILKLVVEYKAFHGNHNSYFGDLYALNFLYHQSLQHNEGKTHDFIVTDSIKTKSLYLKNQLL